MNKTMRRVGGVVLSAVFAGSVLTACGNDEEENAASDQVVSSEDDRPVEERFEWQARAADPNGILIFQPKGSESKGQILSTETRSYEPGSEEAKTSEPEGVVFQLVDSSPVEPVPFSESDGPTGFDGMVPTGYTQSAAGAALAAAAYAAAAFSPNYPEFIEKASVGATEETRKRVESVAAQIAQDKETLRSVHTVGRAPASEGVRVELIRPDYARVTIYSRGEKENGMQGLIALTRDLEWVDGQWKMNISSNPSVSESDQLPEEACTWNQS